MEITREWLKDKVIELIKDYFRVRKDNIVTKENNWTSLIDFCETAERTAQLGLSHSAVSDTTYWFFIRFKDKIRQSEDPEYIGDVSTLHIDYIEDLNYSLKKDFIDDLYNTTQEYSLKIKDGSNKVKRFKDFYN